MIEPCLIKTLKRIESINVYGLKLILEQIDQRLLSSPAKLRYEQPRIFPALIVDCAIPSTLCSWIT
jgi:hypothetical protein